jgi:hypothetical protein
LRSRSNELEQAQKQLYSVEIEYKSQITRITTTYESKITELVRESQLSHSKEAVSPAEVDRLNMLLINKNAEI